MIRRTWMLAVMVGAAVLMTASPAQAKGADQVTITGPGISKPIVVGGNGEPGSAEGLGQLSDGSGLFVAMFGPSSSGAMTLTSVPPTGPLGPKYELVYRVPGANPTPDMLKQDVYPLAAGGPVTFTAAGQAVLGTETTGGWYRASATFRPLLASLGVPGLSGAAETVPPSHPQPTTVADAGNAGPAHRTPWLAIVAGAIGLCIAATAVAVVRRSSRPRVTSPR
jgi:hypothetical protein